MSDFLQKMVASSTERAELARKALQSFELDKPLSPIKVDAFGVIAEIKDSSPSEGALATRSRAEQAQAYIEGGAAAISVLTEPSCFAGDITHLEAVVSGTTGTGVPVMRKDFLVDAVQIIEARAAGASGVLLIAAMLNDKALASLLDCAYEHSMFVLLESFDGDDLQRSANLLKQQRHFQQAERGQLMIGINTRNLRTLDIDKDRLAQLATRLPPAAVAVAESGIHTPADAAAVANLGYGMALVGTALMKSSDPKNLLVNMCQAGLNA